MAEMILDKNESSSPEDNLAIIQDIVDNQAGF